MSDHGKTLDFALTALRAGRHKEAAEFLERVVAATPQDGQAHALLGWIHLEARRLDEALAHARKAVATARNARFHHLLADVLLARGDAAEAAAHFSEATKIEPGLAVAWGELGYTLATLGRLNEAVAALERAVSLAPHDHGSTANLARALHDLGQFERAWAVLQDGERRGVRLPMALATRAFLLEKQGRVPEAVKAFSEAVAADPGNASLHADHLLTLHHDPEQTDETLSNAHREWAHRHETPIQTMPQVGRHSRANRRRLRVGYVSADFCSHAVASFLLPVVTQHDRTAVELFAYSGTSQPDATTERFRSAFEHWRDTASLSDDDLASLVRSDEVDVLVDLSGHTRGNRLLAFARRPAPVQVTYLGYPGTTGMTRMDYRLTDAFVDPMGQERFHSERLLRLPTPFFRFSPPATITPVSPLPALATGSLTFGSFHKLIKLNGPTIRRWSRILTAVPDSRLLIYRNNLRPQHQAYFRDLFRREGITDDRVLMRYEFPPTPGGHFDVYASVDIHLDALPWNGHTILCEILCAGVPTLSIAGSRHASRLGAAVLRSAGLDEFVAADESALVTAAKHWSTHLEELAAIRAAIPQRLANSTLLDYAGLARELEAAYRTMFSDWLIRQA